MRSHGIFGIASLAAVLFVQTITVLAQGDTVLELRDVGVTVVDHRLVLTTADDTSYVLAALEVPEECPATGGRTWACGEGARQSLAATVKGEVLECSIVEPGDPPSVECHAQTRNLNQWMLRVGRARLRSGVRGSIPAYDAAERVARATGAMLWYDPESESSLLSEWESFTTASLSDPDTGREGGRFLVRGGFEGHVLTYELSQPLSDREVRVGYFPSDDNLSIRSAELLPPYVAAIGLGEFIVRPTAEGEFAYAYAPSNDAVVPLAYVMDFDLEQGRPYTTLMFDDHLVWTSRHGVLQPVRLPLGSLAERRGATSAERRALGAELPEDQSRAGVWNYDSFQVVVAEDPSGCEQFTWCRFAVLESGDVVLSGIAREAPELAVVNDGVELVWETPEGAWNVWSPSP